MAFITYLAKREIEPTGYSKTGVDISAAPADDSFNASSTVLTGLLADQWAFLSGFAQDQNKGWFQVKSDSTSGKLLQVTGPITHLRLPGVAGNYASTPDTAANSIATDQGLICSAALSDWTPGSVQTLIAKWNTTGNQRAIALSVNTDGTLNLSWSADGTAVISKNSTVATGVADLAVKYVWASLDVNNGAAGNDVKFWLSDDGIAWTQLGATVTTAGTTAVFNSTAGLEVGSINGGTAQLAVGRIYYAALAAGLTSTPVAAAFNGLLGVRGALSVGSLTGETWTINTSGTPPALLQGSALKTEAAGPSVTIKGYARGLNQSYSLEFYVEAVPRKVKGNRTVSKPIGGGAAEVVLQNRQKIIDVTVLGVLGNLITEAQMLQWREFLESVMAGEFFTFDRYGTVASPIEPKVCQLESDEYTEERIAGVGALGLYKISFSARIIS